jgi:hypothetical protein
MNDPRRNTCFVCNEQMEPMKMGPAICSANDRSSNGEYTFGWSSRTQPASSAWRTPTSISNDSAEGWAKGRPGRLGHCWGMHPERSRPGYGRRVSSQQLNPEFVAGYRERCERILWGQERPYDVAGELMALISDYLGDLPGAAYVMWGELTDVCELRSEEACAHAEELMRQATSEFLGLTDYGSQLPAYADRWVVRIAKDERLTS